MGLSPSAPFVTRKIAPSRGGLSKFLQVLGASSPSTSEGAGQVWGQSNGRLPCVSPGERVGSYPSSGARVGYGACKHPCVFRGRLWGRPMRTHAHICTRAHRTRHIYTHMHAHMCTHTHTNFGCAPTPVSYKHYKDLGKVCSVWPRRAGPL